MSLFKVEELVRTGGILLVSGIVFAESGLLVGFFLPGDSLLMTAGFLASQEYMYLPTLIICTIAAAILGDNTGYWFGSRAGKRIMEKEDSLFFHREHIERAQQFYEKHGGKTIIIARFVPIVRTFAPLVAGMGNMNRKRFMLFNAVGGILWGGGVTLAGYVTGRVFGRIIDIDKYLLPFLGLVALASLIPALYHLFKTPESRAKLKKKIVARK